MLKGECRLLVDISTRVGFNVTFSILDCPYVNKLFPDESNEIIISSDGTK